MQECYDIINAPPTLHSPEERRQAQNRFHDALMQREMLIKSSTSRNQDFYSYRYLAGQGFMPGYNFPRLPLIAWLPGKEDGMRNMHALSRPRFLALSEFGPRSLIYHCGGIYQVKRIKLRAQSGQTGTQLPTETMQICPSCGHAHLVTHNNAESNDASGSKLDICNNCGTHLEASSSISNLYLVETVETELKEHISINDEERQRQGYELQTCYCFDQRQPVKSKLMLGDAVLAMLTYAPSARIWRINKGWSRRSDRNTLGFVINPSNGKWSKEETLEAEAAGAEENNNATKKTRFPHSVLSLMCATSETFLSLRRRRTSRRSRCLPCKRPFKPELCVPFKLNLRKLSLSLCLTRTTASIFSFMKRQREVQVFCVTWLNISPSCRA